MVLLYRGLLYDTGINLNKQKSFSSFHEVNTSSTGVIILTAKMGTDCSGGLIYSKKVTGCRGMPLQGIGTACLSGQRVENGTIPGGTALGTSYG